MEGYLKLQQCMRPVSHWAKDHIWPARIIILICYILTNILGVKCGLWLRELGVNISFSALVILAFCFISGIILNPGNRLRSTLGSLKFYARQRTAYLVIALSSFGFIVSWGNHLDMPAGYQAGAVSHVILHDSLQKKYKSITEFQNQMKDKNGDLESWKKRKNMLKQQVKGIKKSNDLSVAEKILLIILSVAVAAGLLYLLAWLACSLSCNGMALLALVVAVGGTAGIIFLLIICIRAILGK